MPPLAKSLAEEGVVIPPTFLYRNGKARFESIEQILTAPPWPTRSVEDNLADLKAQAAANLLGTQALQRMATEHGSEKVVDQMQLLHLRAADAIARRIQSLPAGQSSAEENLDDGARLKAAITIGESKIKIDFTGTDALHLGNFNATPAIVQSAVIYVVRLLVDEPVPLNEGLLEHVEITLPRCLLNPDFPDDPAEAPPVVGGNVETSQRLVNLLLKPFGIVAASQGTMNNLIFGNDRYSYYETICGGTGAGARFDGADGVHSHMTTQPSPTRRFSNGVSRCVLSGSPSGRTPAALAKTTVETGLFVNWFSPNRYPFRCSRKTGLRDRTAWTAASWESGEQRLAKRNGKYRIGSHRAGVTQCRGSIDPENARWRRVRKTGGMIAAKRTKD